MIKAPYIVWDVETGGLNCMNNPITQFAAIVLDYNTLKEVDRFETFVKPYDNLKIEPKVLELTMLSMSDINSGLSISDFVKTLISLLKNNRGTARGDFGRLVCVGHNTFFDLQFITYALAHEGHDIFDYIQDSFVDTMLLSKMTWGITGTEKLKLGICCEKAGISLVDAHSAMNDVHATVGLLRFFVNRMRSESNMSSMNSINNDRPRGNKFFEFDCGAINLD
jgi:DNA polymerase III alpha subunit (gram-positive type)